MAYYHMKCVNSSKQNELLLEFKMPDLTSEKEIIKGIKMNQSSCYLWNVLVWLWTGPRICIT